MICFRNNLAAGAEVPPGTCLEVNFNNCAYGGVVQGWVAGPQPLTRLSILFLIGNPDLWTSWVAGQCSEECGVGYAIDSRNCTFLCNTECPGYLFRSRTCSAGAAAAWCVVFRGCHPP